MNVLSGQKRERQQFPMNMSKEHFRCVGDSPLKKFGGFMPNLICFQFLESVENGKIQEDNEELVAVAAEYNMYAAGLDEDTLHKTYYDAIFDLLSALETKYGEFKLSMNVSTVNNEYANHKFWGRDLYERAKAYNADLIEYELKGIGSRIAAVNFGNNNTGIALVTQESSYKRLIENNTAPRAGSDSGAGDC